MVYCNYDSDDDDDDDDGLVNMMKLKNDKLLANTCCVYVGIYCFTCSTYIYMCLG